MYVYDKKLFAIFLRVYSEIEYKKWKIQVLSGSFNQSLKWYVLLPVWIPLYEILIKLLKCFLKNI